MGGYSSTPRKAKTTEEGGDGSIHYTASGMQVSEDETKYFFFLLGYRQKNVGEE